MQGSLPLLKEGKKTPNAENGIPPPTPVYKRVWVPNQVEEITP